MENGTVRILSPGKVFIDYGPASMVVMAFQGEAPLTGLCQSAFAIVDAALREITQSLPYLRLPPLQIPSGTLTGLPLKMLEAVLAVGEPTLTPMATVAGAVSDTVADWLFEQGASRVIVNNGGDIALRLLPGERVRVGILSSLAKGEIDTIVPINADHGIGGIATSGLGGRSFTRGIANAVSVFSSRCILADALATHLANHTLIPSAQIKTVKAGSIDPLSDIADLDIVTEVGILTDDEVAASLQKLLEEAQRQYSKKLFLGMRANVQTGYSCFPETYFTNITKGDE
ncbi:MAG TPA: hypothetical protein DIT32_06160 [Peptococcaceae bacterium]|nr:hypothetical protein [Peptococcaceae bacterium]